MGGRLIDADALKKRVSELIVPDWTRTLIRSWLDSEPTVDAVPVVRCKDCKHNKGKKVWHDGEVTIDCDNDMGYTPLDFFCADGERRTE